MIVIFNSILLGIIASLLGIILNYIRKFVNSFEVLKEQVNKHEVRITVIEKTQNV